MKKFILSSLIGLVSLVSVHAASLSVTILPGVATNVIPFINNGFARVTSVAMASTGTTNSAVDVYDSATNNFTYISPVYTNTVSYMTNLFVSWTNYFGVVNTVTNLTLIDNTNNLVGPTTNTYPRRFSVAALAGTTTTINPTSYIFENGVLATNTSSGIVQLTLQYVQ